jgi:hypothetical protein
MPGKPATDNCITGFPARARRPHASKLHASSVSPALSTVCREALGPLATGMWGRTLRGRCYPIEPSGEVNAAPLSLEADAPVPKRRSALRHDHVTTRRSILACLASPGADVEATLRSVISCTVTKAEHERLTKFDDTCVGWDRYIAARIDVYDLATGIPFIQDGQYA